MSDKLKEGLNKSTITEVLAGEAGDRVKPGVERSGTPGIATQESRAREAGDREF